MDRRAHLGLFIHHLVDGVLLLCVRNVRYVGETGGLFRRVDDGKRVHTGLTGIVSVWDGGGR